METTEVTKKKCSRLVTRVARHAIRTAALPLALLAAPAAALAQTPPAIIGSLANFDAVNDDNLGEKHGFEIQLEGLQVQDITRVFGQADATTCYIRYCIGSITSYSDAATGKSGVYVRWMAKYDALTHTFTTPSFAPGGGTGTPNRAGVPNLPLVSGEACWSIGLGTAYAASGCEHFGVSALRNPTQTTYRWLTGDPATGIIGPATVVNSAGVTVPAPPVAIPHPIAVVAPIGGVDQVQAVIQAPLPNDDVDPLDFPRRYGKAQWVKVYKTELGRHAELDELVGGHPNHVIEDALAAPVETEWKLLQYDVRNPDKGSSQLENHGSKSGSQSVVRRYEFYEYTGPVETDRKKTSGNPKLSSFDEAQSLCPKDPVKNECTEPGSGELGDYIGAQMAAQNLGADTLIDQTITGFTLPTPLTYGDAPFTVSATGGGSGNPVLFAATGACTNAGTLITIVAPGACMVTASQAGNASYVPAWPITLTEIVAKAPASVTFGPSTLSQTYDGTVKTVATTTTPAGLRVDVAFTGTPHDAGSYPVTATINEPLYTGSAADALTIGPAPSTVMVLCPASATYTGAAIAPCTAQATGEGMSGVDVTASLIYADNTNVGAATATAGWAGDANHTASSPGTGGFAITPAGSTVTVLCPASATYTGAAIALCTAQATGAGMSAVDVTASLIYAANTNVGAATATAGWAGDANHTASAGTGGFAITPAGSTVTVLCPASVIFTGAAIAPCTASYSGAGGLSGSLTPSYSNNVNVGTASARATYAGDANHAGSTGTASFTIAAAPPARNPIVNPGPQVSHEGDEVELRIHLIGAGGKHHDDDSRPRGSFAASGLPPQLHMEGRQGVIRGHIRKGGDAGPSGKREYQSTVTFTRNSVTYSQSFRWTVLDSHKKHKKGDSDHKDGEDGRQGR